MGTVHFRVGADMGITLAEIAQEHLLYNYNPKKALDVFTDSFGGECPEELKISLLKGDHIILVDVEEQIFDVVERKDHMHLDKIYPKLDVRQWYKRKHNEIGEQGREIYSMLERAMNKMVDDDGFFNLEITYNSIFEYINGVDEYLLKEIKEDKAIHQIRDLIHITKSYLESTQKLYYTMMMIEKWYPEELKTQYEPRFDGITTGRHMIVESIRIRLEHFLKQNTELFQKEQNEEYQGLNNYINATLEIDKTLEKGIEPVEIKDNYSAGWLAPNGDYYALNGEIANNLHIQIADALRKAGIIPNDIEEKKVRTENCTWLERNGYVKIHGNWILYDGYNQIKRGGKNIPLTDIQIKKLYEYGALCHNGALKIGFKQELITAIRFKDTEPLMYQKLFDF